VAGLNCALELADAGIRSTVYEASGRIGGRMFSNAGYFNASQITEWCGELIDTGHTTIRGLAKRFGLPLDNLLGAQPNRSDDVYRDNDRRYGRRAGYQSPSRNSIPGASACRNACSVAARFGARFFPALDA